MFRRSALFAAAAFLLAAGTAAADVAISGLPSLNGQVAPSDPIVTVHNGTTVQVPVSSLLIPANSAPTTLAQGTFGGTAAISFPNGLFATNVAASGTSSASVFAFLQGPTFTFGAGVPTSNQPAGSLYLRTDAVGLYQSTGSSSWEPVVSTAEGATSVLVRNAVAFGPVSLGAGPTATSLVSALSVTTGVSNGAQGDWLCKVEVSGTLADTTSSATPVLSHVTYGIAGTAGTSALTEYSDPQTNAANGTLTGAVADASVLVGEAGTGSGTEASDADQTSFANPRYEATYANDTTVTFSFAAVPSSLLASDALQTSGMLSVECDPQ